MALVILDGIVPPPNVFVNVLPIVVAVVCVIGAVCIITVLSVPLLLSYPSSKILYIF